MSFDRRVPIFPSRRDFVAYLHRYVEVLELPVETGVTVTAVERHGDEWIVRTDDGGHRRARRRRGDRHRRRARVRRACRT